MSLARSIKIFVSYRHIFCHLSLFSSFSSSPPGYPLTSVNFYLFLKKDCFVIRDSANFFFFADGGKNSRIVEIVNFHCFGSRYKGNFFKTSMKSIDYS